MEQVETSYEKLIERFTEWAETCPDIRAAVIVGSRARVDHPADEWADLDIVIITTDPERYISTSDWIDNVGNPLLTFVEPTASGDEMERRVLFKGMLDIDFSIFPEEKTRRMQQLVQDRIPQEIAAQVSNVFGRGMRVLLDKDSMFTELKTILPSIRAAPPRPPTQHEFLEVINDFLYHAVFTAKHLRRGELWWTVTCLNCYMQRLMLRMMEWHARATHGQNYDTWFRGRFLEKWGNPQALKKLCNAFAHYSADDTRNALLATMDLFHWIAMETAEKFGYPYPAKVDEHITKWVRNCLS